MTEALSPFGDRAVRAALAAMPGVSVVVVDREMRIVSVEGGALIRHGYIPERVVGRRAPDVLPAPAWETLGPLYTRALTGETVTVELPSHDGTAVYESTFAPLREAGELVGATISSRDVTAARGALHRAEASGRRLRALLDTSPDGHCRHDAQGRVLWASRAMSTLLGCAPAELDGSRVPSALHPEDREPLTRAFERVRRTREPQTVEVRCCHPDGSWRWLEVAVRGLFADTGDALEIHTTWRDTTSRYDADQLRAQWRHAFDRTTVGVAVIDPITHRMERVNDAFARMHGGVPSDFEGRHLGDTFAPHERGRIRDISQRAHAVGYVRYEADHVRLDGTAFPTETEVIAARDAEGNLVYRLGYFRDVTEERRAQQELVRREADFRMLAETSTDVVLRIAPDGSLRYVSPAATAVLGASPEHVDAGFLHRSTLPEDRCQNAELRAAVVRDGRSRTSESRFTRPDGEQVWLETTIRALHDDTGEVIELHASVRDITRRRRGEDAARLWQLSWEVAPRGLAILDEESGLVEAVNPVFAAQHGGRPEDFVGRSLRDLLPASELQRAGSIASAMEVEGRVTTEVDHLRLDGSRFPARVELVAIRDHDGRVVRRISVCTDLTEERARAEAERRATSRFERAFSEAPAGMALLRDGRFERVNEALASLLEVPADELVGERMARFADAFASADPLEARDGEQRLITARGRIVQVRVRSSVLREGAAGDALLIHVIDLTAEVEVRAARERASAQFEAAFGAAPIGLALVGLDGHWLRVNPALCRLFGRSEEDLLASDFQTLTHPDDLDADLELLEQTLAGERAGYEMSKRYLRSDGTVVDARLSVSLLRDREGTPLHFVSQIVDVSDLVAAQREVATANARLNAVLDHSPVAISLLDAQGRWELVNREAASLLGADPEDLVGRALHETVPEEQRRALVSGTESVRRTGVPLSRDERLEDPRTGMVRDQVSVMFPVSGLDGGPDAIGQVSLDVTARDRALRELAAAHELFAVGFETAPAGMLISRLRDDGTTDVLQCNAAFASMVGRRPEGILGGSEAALLFPEDQATHAWIIAEVAAGRRPARELRLRHADGRAVWALVAGVRVLDADGRPLLLLQAVDISVRRHMEVRLRHLADHDPLTDLFGRRRFHAELRREVQRVVRDGGTSCLLLLDLDGFKAVNDLLGHSAGDELLVRVAAALRQAVRATDVLARIGGDEFALVLPGASVARGRSIARELASVIRRAGVLEIDGGRLEVTASVGVTVAGGDRRIDADELLVEADLAMYQAKDAGKDGVVVYAPDHVHRARISHRTDRLARLRRAVREQRFELLAQPIALLGEDPAPHEPTGHELLLRLRDPELGLMAPSEFLGLAERHGLMADIDRWVLRSAISLLSESSRAGRCLALSVNLSARTVQDPRIVDDVATMLRAHPIPPGSLTVEITETAAITDPEGAAAVTRRLRELGCRLALDDFGAGFASFSTLKHLEFDVLKIDGDFIDHLPTSPVDQAVVRGVVDVARCMGIDVVAERVGDDRTIAVLRAAGVRLGQGFFLGAPVPVAELHRPQRAL